MLKAVRTLRLVRPLVASSSTGASNFISAAQPIGCKLVRNAELHTSAKRLGGGDAEFLVRIFLSRFKAALKVD